MFKELILFFFLFLSFSPQLAESSCSLFLSYTRLRLDFCPYQPSWFHSSDEDTFFFGAAVHPPPSVGEQQQQQQKKKKRSEGITPKRKKNRNTVRQKKKKRQTRAFFNGRRCEGRQKLFASAASLFSWWAVKQPLIFLCLFYSFFFFLSPQLWYNYKCN